MEDFKLWLIKGLKTTVRYFVIFALPVALDAAIQGLGDLVLDVPSLKLDSNSQWVLRGALAFFDKVVHEWRKEVGTEGRWKGLVGI